MRGGALTGADIVMWGKWSVPGGWVGGDDGWVDGWGLGATLAAGVNSKEAGSNVGCIWKLCTITGTLGSTYSLL